MRQRRRRWGAALALVTLAMMGCSPRYGGGVDHGIGRGVVADDGWTVLAATPELDSLPLFGAGLAGLASYVMLARRARK